MHIKMAAKYLVKKIDTKNIGIDDPVWNDIEELKIDCCPWPEFKTDIKTTAKLMYCDTGLIIRFETDERPLRATVTDDHGPVYTDSCVEFFFRQSDSDNYINMEINPFGSMLVGNCKPGRTLNLIDFDKDAFNTISRINSKTWAFQFTVPFSFISEQIGKLRKTFRANFYKCGDMTEHKHYACWSPIDFERPNFHLPEFFGEIELI